MNTVRQSTAPSTRNDSVSAPRSRRSWRLALVAVTTPVLLSATAACGDDSTVDNSEQATNTGVPSVSSSASPESAAPESSSSAAAPAPEAGNSAPDANDSGAEEVDQVPAGTGRSEEDQKYLEELKNNDIDLSKVDGASDPGGVEDQLIAAGRGYCTAKAEDRPDVFTALAAGQLQTQGIVDKDPQEIEKVIVDAADSAYCS